MNTSILTVVLASAVLAGQDTTPTWQNSYGQALQQGSAQRKPLAVVFASGPNNWTHVIRETAPAADVQRLLSEKYVCVYVDTATEAGRKLAQDFGMNGPIGLVLSDRTGSMQAFWSQGSMNSQMLVSYLQKYGDPQVVVTTTEIPSATGRTSLYPPQNEVRTSNYPSFNHYQDGSNPFVSGYCPGCSGGGRGRR
jgi:hypothetical protein